MKCKLFTKYCFIFLLAAVMTGCSAIKGKEDYRIITGPTAKSTLSTPEFPWFETNYRNYVVPDDAIAELKSLITDDVRFVTFSGTWCSDSRRWVPQFYKLMDVLNCENYEVIGLDRQKASPQKTEKNYSVNFVPTFIILKNGKELERFLENMPRSLHEDFIEVLKKAN